MSNQVATTILNQLGGNRFIAMTGSKNFRGKDNGLVMNLTKNKSSSNRLEIRLMADDTYTMIFYTQSGVSIKKLYHATSVYFDELCDYFTNHTGLMCSFGQNIGSFFQTTKCEVKDYFPHLAE